MNIKDLVKAAEQKKTQNNVGARKGNRAVKSVGKVNSQPVGSKRIDRGSNRGS